MLPIVGLTPLVDEKLESQWMLPGYAEMLLAAGAVPMVLPLSADHEVLDRALKACAGVVFCGGHDLAPELYGQTAGPALEATCPERDAMEPYVFAQARAAGMPILGICRGLQLINVCMGGTLYQDLPTERPSEIAHSMQAPYDRAVHSVELAEGGLLARLIGARCIGVNSCHHQAVRELGAGLCVEATAADGVVEAVRGDGYPFMLGVQWHPEFWWKDNPVSMDIASAFVEACR